MRVDAVPEPTAPALAAACERLGLMTGEGGGGGTGGLCLRYGIYVNARRGEETELIVHELVHTLQYERLEGIEGFLIEYMSQFAGPTGYVDAPMEVEARERAAELCWRG